MCGICGFLSPAGLPAATLEKMNAVIYRRGPDGEGSLHSGAVGLAMRRLAIIDIDGGTQPVYNEDRSVALVFNGEIYNYRSLRDGLIARGHQFRSNSDTETIVHLYEERAPHVSAVAGELEPPRAVTPGGGHVRCVRHRGGLQSGTRTVECE